MFGRVRDVHGEAFEPASADSEHVAVINAMTDQVGSAIDALRVVTLRRTPAFTLLQVRAMGFATAEAIAQRVRTDRTVINRALGRLERDGLVTRGKKQGREIPFELTSAGAMVVAQIVHAYMQPEQSPSTPASRS